jgi:hypothetical protein
VVNASSSTGIKPNGEVGLHFFFLLDVSVHPSYLESYYKSINFASKEISRRLTLQPSNMSLKWVIDPVVARNAQIIYIADPVFENRDDPFVSPADRWAICHKERATCDIHQQVMSVDQADVDGKANKLLNQLRRERGLGKFSPRTRTMTVMGHQQRVMINPDQLDIVFSYESDNFVYWNVNGGDSNAYYNPKSNPEIIYNFKGEPPFLFKKASESVYNDYVKAYSTVISEVQERRPLLLFVAEHNAIYGVEYVPAHNEVTAVNKITRDNAEDWMAGYGMPMPDNIRHGDIVFDPQSVNEIEWGDEKSGETKIVVNTFQATDYIKNPPMVMPTYANATRETAVEKLRGLCPTISDILLHICGSSELELGYFINWLAYTLQKRDKAHTAWVFSGVPGTGKGVFYERILRPLVGEAYAVRKRLDHLEEQFNAYQERALFLIWEEFRLKDSKQSGKLLNKMKDDITADFVNIRAMRTDVRSARNYTNYIFFSNHTDVIPIEKGDRRFNIAPAQMERLEHKYPDIRTRINRGDVEGELGSLAGFMLAFDIDEQVARTERNNEAKNQMRLAAMSTMDQFANAVNTGDLEFFYRIEDMQSATTPEKAMRQKIAESCLDQWKKDAVAEKPTNMTLDLLHVCFEVIFDDKIAAIKLEAALTRRDLLLRRMRTGSGKRKKCVTVTWAVPEEEMEHLESDLAEANSADDQPEKHPMMH